MRKNKHKCLVCGHPLAKKVVISVFRKNPMGYADYFKSELEAHMQISTMRLGRHETAKVKGVDNYYYIAITRDGGGWQGLNKVCGRKNAKCLKTFVRKAKFP